MLLVDRDAQDRRQQQWRREAADSWMEKRRSRRRRRVWLACFITWTLVGRARDGAALGWTDASPKRNHRISSTQEERTKDKGEEKERTSKWEGRGKKEEGAGLVCSGRDQRDQTATRTTRQFGKKTNKKTNKHVKHTETKKYT